MAAARFAVLKITGGEMGSILGFRRWMQSVAQSPPLAGIIDNGVQSSQSVLPEFSSQSSYLGGSLELMAVPKKKISKHKRGIRNGPKALKPTPVIVLCNIVHSDAYQELWPCQASTLLLLWWRTEQGDRMIKLFVFKRQKLIDSYPAIGSVFTFKDQWSGGWTVGY
ncbi:hypothetical protein Ahy_A03g010560 isoform A [Arachis hypogaea]|uniref:Large ribosomal subunit protein bL32m n=1 Tax=Arachis hypogaea TaxID=3818 RepID=A0A445DMR8_ARAHY|nr:hypothetical protein Ahy_A03g010560 isoform A [Arachis hypogaea]